MYSFTTTGELFRVPVWASFLPFKLSFSDSELHSEMELFAVVVMSGGSDFTAGHVFGFSFGFPPVFAAMEAFDPFCPIISSTRHSLCI